MNLLVILIVAGGLGMILKSPENMVREREIRGRIKTSKIIAKIS